jgi:uncharacterized RDD family membrane protein YckC
MISYGQITSSLIYSPLRSTLPINNSLQANSGDNNLMRKEFPGPHNQLMPAFLARRLGALLYDTLVSIAIMMCITGIYMAIHNLVVGAEQYQAITDAGRTTHDPLLSSILFISLFTFFAYFWTKNGQTLGMQAWQLRIQNSDNTHINLKQALVRFMIAIISIGAGGLGYIWMLIDKKDRTWQCILSDTEIIRVPKK